MGVLDTWSATADWFHAAIEEAKAVAVATEEWDEDAIREYIESHDENDKTPDEQLLAMFRSIYATVARKAARVPRYVVPISARASHMRNLTRTEARKMAAARKTYGSGPAARASKRSAAPAASTPSRPQEPATTPADPTAVILASPWPS